MKHVLVLITVLITIGSSLILDFGASRFSSFSFYSLIVVGLAFSLNVGKFLVWGQIHKNYELSKSYPLTSIFFPLIFIVALVKGETEFSINKLVGVLLILVGLFIYELKKRK